MMSLSEAGFTKGPWVPKFHGSIGNGDVSMYWFNERLSVCSENPADIPLLAAAPELYEALERLFAVTVSLKFERGDGPPIISDAAYDKALAATRAALAKARGEDRTNKEAA